MPYFIISIDPLVYLISYLCACVRLLEINYIDRDGIYYYGFSINNYDKEKSGFKYFVFVEDICISMIKRQTGTTLLFEMKDIRQGVTNLSLDINNGVVACRDSYRLVFKHKWRDPYISNFWHTLRVYSTGVVIHSTKLFKFIYRIDAEGNVGRRRL